MTRAVSTREGAGPPRPRRPPASLHRSTRHPTATSPSSRQTPDGTSWIWTGFFPGDRNPVATSATLSGARSHGARRLPLPRAAGCGNGRNCSGRLLGATSARRLLRRLGALATPARRWHQAARRACRGWPCRVPLDRGGGRRTRASSYFLGPERKRRYRHHRPPGAPTSPCESPARPALPPARTVRRPPKTASTGFRRAPARSALFWRSSSARSIRKSRDMPASTRSARKLGNSQAPPWPPPRRWPPLTKLAGRGPGSFAPRPRWRPRRWAGGASPVYSHPGRLRRARRGAARFGLTPETLPS